MYCQRATDLLRTLKTSKWLPPYDDAGIKAVTKECEELHNNILSTLTTHEREVKEGKQEIAASLIVNHNCLLRNKRCVLAYLMHRVRKVSDQWWETGLSLTSSSEGKHNLSKGEEKFLNGYNDLMTKYMKSCNMILNSDMQPPQDQYVFVHVEVDCGEIQTDLGPVRLRQGSRHFLRLNDCELLLRQKMLTLC